MASKNTPKADPTETVHVTGSLDRGLEEVDIILAADKADIVLDFTACTFVSVDGLEWLEELLLRAQSKKHRVILVGIPPTVYKVFKVSHIDSILKACGSPVLPSGPVC